MAISYLEIDTALLKKDMEGIQADIDTVCENLQSMFEDIEVLNTMWEGKANKTFNNQFKMDYVTMEEILKDMQNYIVSIENACMEYVKCENAVNEAVRAIRI